MIITGEEMVCEAFDTESIVTRDKNGKLWKFTKCELENIPEKCITSQVVELVNFDFGPRIMMKSNTAYYVNVRSRAEVSYTKDGGWSIKELMI